MATVIASFSSFENRSADVSINVLCYFSLKAINEQVACVIGTYVDDFISTGTEELEKYLLTISKQFESKPANLTNSYVQNYRYMCC